MTEQEQGQSSEPQYKEAIKIDNAGEALANSAKALVKFGGFGMIEKTIKGTGNLNPESKARKKIFLTDATKKSDRVTLKQTLEAWYELMANSETAADMAGKAQEKADSASKTLKKNLKKGLEATRELESNYRALNLFYKNTESEKIKNITIMNADIEQLKDLDNPIFFDEISEELSKSYDRLDLRSAYSLLTIPGYLGSNQVVEKWAKLAHKNKMMMVTDFENLESADGITEFFESANLTSGDVYKKSVVMTSNWLVGRAKDEAVGEDEDVYVSPAAALAGNMYKTRLGQVAAGKKYGSLSEVPGVRLNLKKSELTNMEKLGLVPMVGEFGKVMAMSAKTLFNGDNTGHQTYSVVRVFDYIMKVLMHFLNQRAFENTDSDTMKEIRAQVVKFLDSVTGPGMLIEKFSIQRFDRDPNQKDRVFLDIHMTPYFPGKTYVIGLDGQKGDDAGPPKWMADTKEQ